MKQMSQKELLREGFASMLGTTARSVGGAAKTAVTTLGRDLAPEVADAAQSVIRAFTPKQQRDKESLGSFLEKDPNINKFNTTHYDEKSDTWASTVNDKPKFYKLSGNTWKEVILTPEKQKDILNAANTVPEPKKSNTQKPSQSQKEEPAPSDK